MENKSLKARKLKNNKRQNNHWAGNEVLKNRDGILPRTIGECVKKKMTEKRAIEEKILYKGFNISRRKYTSENDETERIKGQVKEIPKFCSS